MGELNGAHISECRRYRYALWRTFGAVDGPAVCFLMLNPSTADDVDDDPTIRRCIGFTKAWGGTRLFVVNLFALRSTDPMGLLRSDDPVGPGNNDVIAHYANRARRVVCAWGSPSTAALRKLVVQRALTVKGCLKRSELVCLGTAKGGAPRHPLYLPANASLRVYG